MSNAAPEQVVRAAAAVRDALPLSTQRCVVREVRVQDAGALHGYRSDPQVTQFLGHPPADADEVRRQIGDWLCDPASVSTVVEKDGRVVGDVRVRFRPASALAPATTTRVEAALGYAFHPGVHGQGLATESVRAVLGAALGAGVRRVTARVFAPAVPSSRLLARLGFTRDGVDRACVLSPDGSRWWDDELWSLVPDRDSMPGA